MKRTYIALIALIIIAPALVLAESTDCHNPVTVTPDGRPTYTQYHLNPNTNYYWQFWGQQGHSYSLEFVYDAQNSQAVNEPYLLGVRVFNVGDNNCSFLSTLQYLGTGHISPILGGTSIRKSWIAPGPGYYGLWLFEGPNGGNYSFRV